MNADELFASMAGEAPRFAACCALTVDDVRQELYVMCLEVATGSSAYNAAIGGVREYVMGRMWGLVRRWRHEEPLPGTGGDTGEEAERMPAALVQASVEEHLLERERRESVEAREAEAKARVDEERRHVTTLVLLSETHWSQRDGAKACGIARQSLRAHVRRAKAKALVRAVRPQP